MARDLRIPTAAVFEPLLHPARYKGAWGGRGSGKSHFFAGLAIEDALRFKGEHGMGLRMVCLRETQKSLKFSAKSLIEKKLQDFGLGEAQGFRVYREQIELPGDGVMIFNGLQDHTADSVKSLDDFHRAWIEEAQAVSDRSLTLLRPTIRAEGSEIWASWNPSLPTDAIDMMLRSDKTPKGSVVVRANWSDNPWLPRTLEDERRDVMAQSPERYGHIYEGEYQSVTEGAYFASRLTEAQLSGRIGNVYRDPLMKIYAIWDIGSTSNAADATSIWIVQFIGDEIRVLNYYEAIGQAFDDHVHWLRSNGYEDAVCILPHDGRKHDFVHTITPQGFLGRAGFTTDVVTNQGKGAALLRIDAVRALLPRCRFNEETTESGRLALGAYRQKIDDVRGVGLGPVHDWASHAADAFGLVAVYAERANTANKRQPLRRNLKGVV
jgi:phage terminase large subunit